MRRLVPDPGATSVAEQLDAYRPWDDPPADRPRLALPDTQVREVLARHGLAAQGYVVFAPGAEYGPAKRWPHYGALAAGLTGTIVLLGSAKDVPFCEEIAAQAPTPRSSMH